MCGLGCGVSTFCFGGVGFQVLTVCVETQSRGFGESLGFRDWGKTSESADGMKMSLTLDPTP